MNIACELRKIYFEKIPFKSLSIYVNILVNYWIDCLSDINLAMCDKSCYIVSGYEISSLLNPSTWNVQLKASGYIFFTFLKVPARLPSRPTVWKTVSDYFCFSKDFIAQRMTGGQRTWTLDLNLLVTSWDLGHATSVISIGKTEYEYEYTYRSCLGLTLFCKQWGEGFYWYSLRNPYSKCQRSYHIMAFGGRLGDVGT